VLIPYAVQNPEEMAIMCKESGLDFMRFLSEENRNLDYLSKYLREQVHTLPWHHCIFAVVLTLHVMAGR
jgi:hypothetical protein